MYEQNPREITIKMKVTGVKETGIGILYHKDNGDDYYSHVHNCVYIVKYWMCLCFLYL